jgi:serine/threonine-protein kinase
MAYQLLTGSLPYAAKNPREMFAQLVKTPPTPLNKANPDLIFTDAVEAVVMKGLARKPDDRYPDTVSFATALSEVLATPFPANTGGGLLSKMRGLFGR